MEKFVVVDMIGQTKYDKKTYRNVGEMEKNGEKTEERHKEKHEDSKDNRGSQRIYKGMEN